MQIEFSQRTDKHGDFSTLISLRRDKLGPRGIMLTVRDTVRRSGQSFSVDSNGRFVPHPDNDRDDYR